MNTVIDMNSELLVDRSKIGNPYLRLLLTAIGEELVKGSPWIAVNKSMLCQHDLLDHMLRRQCERTAA